MRKVITSQMVVEDAFCYDIAIQMQLTLICSTCPQRNTLRECYIGQICDSISLTRLECLHLATIVKYRQNKSRFPGNADFTLERVIIAGEVKDYVV